MKPWLANLACFIVEKNVCLSNGLLCCYSSSCGLYVTDKDHKWCSRQTAVVSGIDAKHSPHYIGWLVSNNIIYYYKHRCMTI